MLALLVQLLPHYFGLWRSYRVIMLSFGTVTVRSCVPHETSTGTNSLSLQGQGFDTSSVHVGFVVD